jgi:hypothetical protein
MAQPQVTERIHEASHHRQTNQQHGKRAVRAISSDHRVTLSHGSSEEVRVDRLRSMLVEQSHLRARPLAREHPMPEIADGARAETRRLTAGAHGRRRARRRRCGALPPAGTNPTNQPQVPSDSRRPLERRAPHQSRQLTNIATFRGSHQAFFELLQCTGSPFALSVSRLADTVLRSRWWSRPRPSEEEACSRTLEASPGSQRTTSRQPGSRSRPGTWSRGTTRRSLLTPSGQLA